MSKPTCTTGVHPSPPGPLTLLPATKVGGPDPAERRLYDGAALWCCTSDVAVHPGNCLFRVGLRRTSDGYQPADADDTACPECGAPGQQVSQARTWTRLEHRQGHRP